MKTERVTVIRTFTARDAANVVECSNRFTSEIFFCQPSKAINAKSLMGTISLGLKKGDELVVQVKGVDEDAAVAEVSAYFK